ncbi:MAG: DUF3576 domain-containing protein [Alphaproteobacteria bacterium]|nr:DUF3576 domain-containing protein [Alphaproteobacteria bacterium]
MRPFSRFLSALIILTAVTLGGCSTPVKKEASYPTRPTGTDKILYSDQKRETIWGEGESLSSKLFGKDKAASDGGGGGIGVNSFLWRATLDTISFLPIASADPFGGVILTDWYENPDVQGERFKLNIYILDRQLRADGLRVTVFKQKLNEKSGWRDVKISKDVSFDIENAILTRARNLRITQAGVRGN